MTTIKSILEELVKQSKRDLVYPFEPQALQQIEQLIGTKVISSLKHCNNEPCAKSQCKTFHLIKEDMQRELQKVIR